MSLVRFRFSISARISGNVRRLSAFGNDVSPLVCLSGNPTQIATSATRDCCLTMRRVSARSRERSKAIEARDRGNRSRFRSRTLERFRWWRIKRRQEGSCQFAPRTPRQDTANGDVLRLLLLHAPSSSDDWPERADSPRAQDLRLRLVDADPKSADSPEFP